MTSRFTDPVELERLKGLQFQFGSRPMEGKEILTAGDLARSYESNFIAPILLTKAVGEHMIARKTHGSLVLLSSMQGVGVFENRLNYAAPKGAVIHACRILAKQWSGRSIQVN